MSKHTEDPDYSYVNDNGKVVRGTAAALHEIFTQRGGIKNYNEWVGEKFVKEFIKNLSPKINKELEREAKKGHFKSA